MALYSYGPTSASGSRAYVAAFKADSLVFVNPPHGQTLSGGHWKKWHTKAAAIGRQATVPDEGTPCCGKINGLAADAKDVGPKAPSRLATESKAVGPAVTAQTKGSHVGDGRGDHEGVHEWAAFGLRRLVVLVRSGVLDERRRPTRLGTFGHKALDVRLWT